MISSQLNTLKHPIRLRLKIICMLVLLGPDFHAKGFDTDNLIFQQINFQFIDTSEYCFDQYSRKRPNPIFSLIRKKHKKNKKITAAILAFPFPFGIVGLHRIYMGTAPHVPVVYIGTLGGIFGILPFIDFCVLILEKDVDRYVENKKVFMWVND